ncbi:MAG: hypothetical protein LBU68_03095 [Rickettsiales bacterium]|jgi:hypothetical protein|nr:hypothetical protein [Rickettsiales bacterium]
MSSFDNAVGQEGLLRVIGYMIVRLLWLSYPFLIVGLFVFLSYVIQHFFGKFSALHIVSIVLFVIVGIVEIVHLLLRSIFKSESYPYTYGPTNVFYDYD